MSVILYSRDEVLAAFAATWNRGSIGSLGAQRRLEYLAEAARRIQSANMLAYNATYGDDIGFTNGETPITGRSIKSALIAQTVDQKLRGYRCLRGLRYNLIANNGKDFATAEILDDLLGLFQAAFDQAKVDEGGRRVA